MSTIDSITITIIIKQKHLYQVSEYDFDFHAWFDANIVCTSAAQRANQMHATMQPPPAPQAIVGVSPTGTVAANYSRRPGPGIMDANIAGGGPPPPPPAMRYRAAVPYQFVKK